MGREPSGLRELVLGAVGVGGSRPRAMARLVRGPALGAGGCGKQPEVAGRGPDRRGTAAREWSTASRTEPAGQPEYGYGKFGIDSKKLRPAERGRDLNARRNGRAVGPPLHCRRRRLTLRSFVVVCLLPLLCTCRGPVV